MSAVLTDQLTPEDFAAKVKAKYPDYADVPDDELVGRVVEKYPEYRNTVQGFDIPSVISRVATEKGVDPNLMLAIGAQESGYNPKAVSPKNARGVLQVVPGTAARFADPDHDPNTVEGNIRAGTNYVKFLHDRYRGNTDHVIAGYFTGEGNVDKALARGQNLPTTVDTSIGLSTPNYVQQVKGRYNKLTAQNPQQQDDRLSIAEFAAKIKAKYPDYADVPDEELVTRIIAKYPEYKDSVAYQSAQTAPVVNVGAPGRPVTTSALPPTAPVPTGPHFQAQNPINPMAAVNRQQQGTAAQIQRGLQNLPQVDPAYTAALTKAASDKTAMMQEYNEKVQRLNDVGGQDDPSLRTDVEALRRQIQMSPAQMVAQQQQFEQLGKDRALAFSTALDRVKNDPKHKEQAIIELGRYGPVSPEEAAQLGISQSLINNLMMSATKKLTEFGGSVARAAKYIPKLEGLSDKDPDKNMYGQAEQTLQGAGKQLAAQRNVYGSDYTPGGVPVGQVVSGVGEMLPDLALAGLTGGESLPAQAAKFGLITGASAFGRGEDPEGVVKSAAFGAGGVLTGHLIGMIAPEFAESVLGQMGFRVGGNAVLGGLWTAENGGDVKAIASSSILFGAQGLFGGGHPEKAADLLRSPDLMEAVIEHLNNPSTASRDKIAATAERSGLDASEAQKFADNIDGLKSASSQPAGANEDAQGTTTTPRQFNNPQYGRLVEVLNPEGYQPPDPDYILVKNINGEVGWIVDPVKIGDAQSKEIFPHAAPPESPARILTSEQMTAKENQNASTLRNNQNVGNESGQVATGVEVNRGGNNQQVGVAGRESGVAAGRGDDANGDEFVPVAKQYGISPESIEEHIQRATRTRESLPPVEVAPGGNDGRSEVAPEEGRVTGIKNAVTDAERAERGLSPIERDIYDEFPKVFDDVKRGIDSGKIDIRVLTREWAEHPKGLSENEEAALIYDRARLYNNKEEIIDEITSAIASGDKAAEVEARVRLAPIEDAIVANEKAAVRSGTIWGRSGAMRQQMMKSDYSLANIERRFRAKTGDSPTAEQSAKFKKLSEDLEDAQRAVAKRDEIISDLEARRWAKTEARKEAATGRRVKRAGSLDAIKKEWDGQKDALVRLLKLQGIGEPAGGGKKGLGGPEAGAVDPNLVTLPADVAKLLIEMARNRIRAGVTDANEIVDSIHEFVKDKFDVSVRQISDAISGYGKQSKLSTDEVEVQLREVKRIRRLMSALEDAQKGEAPQRSGLKRDKPTRLVRELTRQVNEALRKNGYKLESADRSPEEQYQSALDGVKTRLRNQIQDLNERIATGQKPEGRTPIALDEEAKALKAERDGLAATLQEIDGPRRMTDEQRVASTEKALEKSIADNEQRIADKRLMPDGKPEPADSPRIQELRKRNEEVKKALEDLRKADPAVLAAREASALKTYHKQLATREVEMTKTLADIKAGTYEPRAKRTQRNDPVSVEARARAGRIQDEIEKELLKAQLAKRNWTDKALDFAVKWRRNMLLSNPLTLAKLATAAASRVVISPVEEAVGGIISHLPIASKIAAKAPREGGFSVAAEAKAIYGYTRQLMQFAEAREIVRTGKTRLDTIYGAKGDLPPEAIEFFGRLHKLMKAPAQAAEFARSYQKRIEWALNNKMDPTDPVTQAALASSAYLDAQRAILMQDNMAVKLYRQQLSQMRALDSTGKQKAPNIARLMEFMLPIVKVPTNFVSETSNYALGAFKALAVARRSGWDTSKLTSDQADAIMRALKKQVVGQGLFWTGYVLAGSVGGYHQSNEQRKPGAPGPGEIHTPLNLPYFGHNIPHWLLHSPAMEVMQLGATFRHVMDAHADYSTLGKLGSGALAGVAGLSQQVPFIETPATIADAAKSDRKFGKFAANTVGGMVVPPVVKKIAEFQDSGVKRKPGSVGEDIEMMIPATRFNQGFSRKAVPTEEQRKDEQKQKRDDKKMSPDADKIYENRMKRKGLSP